MGPFALEELHSPADTTATMPASKLRKAGEKCAVPEGHSMPVEL